MTKYLETKNNSIEEAISSVVLGEAKFQVNYSKGGKLFSKTINAKDEDDAEDKAIKKFKIDDDDIRSVVKEGLNENGFVVGKVKMPKMKGGAKLQSKTNFDFRLFDPEDSPGSDKANDEMNREIVKASKMKDKQTAMAHMSKIQRKHSKHGATDTEPRGVISQVLNRVFGESVELDEYTLTKLDKMMGIKKGDRVFFVSGSNAEGNVYAQNEKEALEKAKKKGIRGKISVRDKGEYKGQPTLKNSVNEGKRISPKMLNLMKVITAYKQEKPGSKERKIC